MNSFEQEVIPDSWKDAINGKVNCLLESEGDLYNKFAKSPDTADNFRRFYSHIEPIYSYLADQTAQKFVARDNSISPLMLRAEKSYKQYKLDLFFKKCKKIVVLKGRIDLAHGDILKKQVANIKHQYRSEIGLILIGNDWKSHPEQFYSLNGINIVSLVKPNFSTIKDIYSLIAYSISVNFSKTFHKEIIWWGIPFGMIFTYALAKKLRSANHTDSNIKKYPFSTSLVTVKHHFSFSNTYLDSIYTSTPFIDGFSTLFCPKIKTFLPCFYEESILKNERKITNASEIKLLSKVQNLKLEGFKLFSSVSRLEKITDSDYLNKILNILDNTERTTYIFFGASCPDYCKTLIAKYGSDRFMYGGWLKPETVTRIIGYLDLFIDPFPFGAGMTFVSAAYQEIPVISTTDFIHSSPSTISILHYYASKNNINADNMPCLKNVFSPTDSIARRSINLLNFGPNRSEVHQLKNLISNIFLNSEYSILDTNQ